jgi:hypothetical protein
MQLLVALSTRGPVVLRIEVVLAFVDAVGVVCSVLASLEAELALSAGLADELA